MIWSFQQRCDSALAVYSGAGNIVSTNCNSICDAANISEGSHSLTHKHTQAHTHMHACMKVQAHLHTGLVIFKQRGSNKLHSLRHVLHGKILSWYKFAAVGEDQTEDRTSWKTGSYNWQNCHTLSCQLFLDRIDTGTIKNFKDSNTHEATFEQELVSWCERYSLSRELVSNFGENQAALG